LQTERGGQRCIQRGTHLINCGAALQDVRFVRDVFVGDLVVDHHVDDVHVVVIIR
jgi:hypothetical protein